jgi:hypothetical protein
LEQRERTVSADEIDASDTVRYPHLEEDAGWAGVADGPENPMMKRVKG